MKNKGLICFNTGIEEIQWRMEDEEGESGFEGGRGFDALLVNLF